LSSCSERPLRSSSENRCCISSGKVIVRGKRIQDSESDTRMLATEERGADQRKSSREEESEFDRRTGYSIRELLCLFIHAGALLLLSS